MENLGGHVFHPFPQTRPDVEIAGSGEPIREVDCVELRWWFGIPRPGERTMWAKYDAETLELAWVTGLEATGPARVHGIDCVELRAGEWSAEGQRRTTGHVFYVRVEEAAESRYIAVLSEKGGEKGVTVPKREFRTVRLTT